MILNVMSERPTPKEAIAEIFTQIKSHGTNPALTILFFSSEFEVEGIEMALKEHSIAGELLACSTSGELSPGGIHSGHVVGQVYYDTSFSAKTFYISDLNEISSRENLIKFSEIKNYLKETEEGHRGRASSFGILLVDGLSIKEEDVCGFLYNSIGDLPIVGGSAGDDLHFNKTFVYEEGKFKENVAAIAVITTTRPFEVFKSQHFKVTDKKMVVTEAIPERRIVTEINGMPAADFYADLLNISIDDFSPIIFSRNPLILEIDGEYYVRSIQKMNADKSLTFFCAIDTGLVLNLADKVKIFDANTSLFNDFKQRVGDIDSCLLFECILRKLEILELPEEERENVINLYRENNAVGFYTYGEQFKNIHVNQTLTGVIFGKK